MNKIDISQFYQDLDRAYQSMQGDGLLLFLQDWLEKAKLAGDEEGYIAIANELGSVLRIRGDVDQSLAYYEDILARLRSRKLKKSLSYAKILINAGATYMAKKSYNEAIQAYNGALEILASNPEASDYVISAAFNNRSSAFRALGNLEAAIYDIQKAKTYLDKCKNVEGEKATNLVNTAEIFMETNQLDKAERCLKESVDIFSKIDGGRHVHYPNALASLGKLEYLRKNYSKSAEYYRQAIKKLEDKVGASGSSDLLRRNLAYVESLANNEI